MTDYLLLLACENGEGYFVECDKEGNVFDDSVLYVCRNFGMANHGNIFPRVEINLGQGKELVSLMEWRLINHGLECFTKPLRS